MCSSLISCYHAQADQHQVQYSTSWYSTPTEQHQIQNSNSCQQSLRLLDVDGQSLECVSHSSAVTMLKQTRTRYSTAPAGTPTVDKSGPRQHKVSFRYGTSAKDSRHGVQYTTKPLPATRFSTPAEYSAVQYTIEPK